MTGKPHSQPVKADDIYFYSPAQEEVTIRLSLSFSSDPKAYSSLPFPCAPGAPCFPNRLWANVRLTCAPKRAFFKTKKQLHFEAALKIDPRCRRNHYCRALVALAKGDSKQAEASFKQAVRCRPTSPEEEDVGDFFLRESRSALRALEARSREDL